MRRMVFIAAILAAAALLSVRGVAQEDTCRAAPAGVSCASCHEHQCASWTSGGHARAGASLKGAERDDPSCLTCHAPQGNTDQGVDCAACHGSGFECGEFTPAVAAGRRMPSDADCRSCHVASKRHPDLAFAFPVDYPVVAHPDDKPRDLFTLDGVYRRFQ